MPDVPAAPIGDTRELPASLPPLAALALFLTGDVELAKRAGTDGPIRNLDDLIWEFPDAVHARIREARDRRHEWRDWAAGAGSERPWEQLPAGDRDVIAAGPDVITVSLKQLTRRAREGQLKTTGVRNGIVETMTDADWARLELVQFQASDRARMVDVRRVDGGESEWTLVHFVRDSLLPLCPLPEAAAAPEQPVPQTPAECVTCLQAMASASLDRRTHTRAKLAELCKGKLTHKAWRYALEEAFRDFPEWRPEGGPLKKP